MSLKAVVVSHVSKEYVPLKADINQRKTKAESYLVETIFCRDICNFIFISLEVNRSFR